MHTTVQPPLEGIRIAAILRMAMWGICLTLTIAGTVADAVTLTAVQSRKTHGASSFDIVIDTMQTIGGAVTVEPRAIGVGHQIVFQFDVPVTFGVASAVDEAGASVVVASAIAGSNNDVVVTLTGVPDNKRVKVTLANVNGVDFSVSLGFLLGDVNNSRSVSANDVQQMKARSGQNVDAGNFRFDLNATGVISAADVSAVKSRSPRTLIDLAVAPAFTMQPGNVTIIEGQTAQFVAVASGTPAPSLQWQLSTNSGANWSDIAGATSSPLSIVVVLSDSGRQYRAVATNSAASVNSNAATLTVNAVPLPKAWQPAALISPAIDGDVYNYQIAFSANGDAVAAWQDLVSATVATNIWANRYAPATGWGVPTIIDAGAFDATDAQVGMDASGNAIAVWAQSDGVFDFSSGNPVAIRYNIWSNRYVPGTGWTGATLVETLDGDNIAPRNASAPQIAVSTNGQAIAAWTQANAFFTGADVWVNRYTPGAGWGTAAMLSNGLSSAGGAMVAIDATGNTMSVWYQVVGTRINLFASRNLGTPVQIETGTGNPSSLQVASNASGETVAVWGQGCATWANRYVPGTGWGTATALQTGIPTCAYISNKQVSIDAAGNAIAAWVLNTGANITTYGNRYTAGAGWQGASPINYGGFHFQFAMNAAGNTLAAWQSSSILAGNGDYVAGYNFFPSVQIYGGSGIDTTGSRIAMDASGNAIVLFKRAEVSGVRNTVWAAIYK